MSYTCDTGYNHQIKSEEPEKNVIEPHPPGPAHLEFIVWVSGK